MEENKKPDNPAAFPFSAEYGHPAACGGMTLRDYFAAKAMQAIVSNTTSSQGFGISMDVLTTGAYEVADEMLKQREL